MALEKVSRERRITMHRRDGDRWLMRTAIRSGTVRSEAIGAVLEVDAIYRNSSVA